jgi:hypothetical protein
VSEHFLSTILLAVERGFGAGVLARRVAEGGLRSEQGFRMVGLGSDTSLLIEALRARLAGVRGDAGPAPTL